MLDIGVRTDCSAQPVFSVLPIQQGTLQDEGAVDGRVDTVPLGKAIGRGGRIHTERAGRGTALQHSITRSALIGLGRQGKDRQSGRVHIDHLIRFGINGIYDFIQVFKRFPECVHTNAISFAKVQKTVCNGGRRAPQISSILLSAVEGKN